MTVYQVVDLVTREDETVDLGGYVITATSPVVSGPRGPVGPQGPPGVGATFSYHQIALAATWTVIHNLGIYPLPTILLDDEPDNPVWTDVEYLDANSFSLTFPQPVAGWVHI